MTLAKVLKLQIKQEHFKEKSLNSRLEMLLAKIKILTKTSKILLIKIINSFNKIEIIEEIKIFDKKCYFSSSLKKTI